MKRRRKSDRKRSRPMRAIRLWSYEGAAKAVPYLRSVIGSLREHWLEALSKRRDLDLAAARPGRSTRDELLRGEVLAEGQERAEGRFNDALDELMRLDVFLLDPVRGVALIPFRKEEELAWYVYDHFEPEGLTGWRYHEDPIEQCRPLAPSGEPPGAVPGGTVV